MFDLTFNWAPEPVVEADFFNEIADSLVNLYIPLAESIPAIAADAEHRFDAEGPGWAAWAVQNQPGPQHPYVSTYYGGAGILDDTGGLKAHAGSPEGYEVVGNTVVYEPRSEVDIYLQEGTNNNMYARPFIGLDPPGEAMVKEVFLNWLSEITGGGSGLIPGHKSSSAGIHGKSGRFVRAY